MEEGKRFNVGKISWRFLSWRALVPMIDVLTYGAHKYSVWEDTSCTEYTEVTGTDIDIEESKKDCYRLISTGSNNWKGGLSYVEISESLQRHLNAFMEGEDDDPESKLTHVGHILCNAMFLSYMFLFRKDKDDRYIDKNLENEV